MKEAGIGCNHRGGASVIQVHRKEAEVLEPEEFADFYRASLGRVSRTVAVVAMDGGLAEEVIQEAYARACLRWGKLRAYADPGAWVTRVAINLTISATRERQRQWRWRHELAQTGPSPEASPTRLLEDLAMLTPRQRAVITLHYVDDMTVQTIATHLDMPVGTVKSDLSRARARLLATLERAEQ